MEEGEDLDSQFGEEADTAAAAGLFSLKDLLEEVEAAVGEEWVLGLGEVTQQGRQSVQRLQRDLRAEVATN